MSKVLTFSTKYPNYHHKKGQPTFFVEKILQSLTEQNLIKAWEFNTDLESTTNMDFTPKHHTIRAGYNWKVGDIFSPRIWGNDINPKSGKSGPYQSKQIIIAPDIEIKQIFDLRLQFISRPFVTYKNDKGYNGSYPEGTLEKISVNDGFNDVKDLEQWLLGGKGWDPVFEGQIICWNSKIEYPLTK